MRYVCTICGYVYDEAQNTPWNELSEDWKCPLCGAARSDFRPEDEKKAAPVTPPPPSLPEDIRPLSVIELSVLCSNLAKGCEKQYKPQQAAAFTRLADWFKGQAEQSVDPAFEKLLEKINLDLEGNYPAASAVSGQYGDRGALRSLVWSEKVTLILKSLLLRFAPGGKPVPVNTGVYVCTICGFVFVGDELPDVCPVCKVPNRKFEKIGG